MVELCNRYNYFKDINKYKLAMIIKTYISNYGKYFIIFSIQAHTMVHVSRSIKSIINGINKVFPN